MTANGTEPGPTSRWVSRTTVWAAASWVVAIAGSWWILGELASVLRPLLLAVFLGYVLMPYYSRLRRRLPAPVAITLIGGAAAGVLVGLAFAVYASLLELRETLPGVEARATEVVGRATAWAAELPVVGQSVQETVSESPVRKTTLADQVRGFALEAVNVAGGALVEAATAGLYLFFLLLESTHFPKRVRSAYPSAQAEHILDVFGRINAAIISYLKAKVVSSLILAVPVGLVLWAFGVPFSLLWAILTFLCNFIPYIGTVVAYSLPAAFAILAHDLGWQSVAVLLLLLVCHVGVATVIEPMYVGRAVGLSPLVILAALAVWGLLWGLPGMFLAVPLTVVLKIVFENIEATRPVARLLSV